MEQDNQVSKKISALNMLQSFQILKVENIEVSWGRKKLKIEIDLDKNFGLTKRGKSIRIATTKGRKFIVRMMIQGWVVF